MFTTTYSALSFVECVMVKGVKEARYAEVMLSGLIAVEDKQAFGLSVRSYI